MSSNPSLCMLAYCTSCMLDAVDGHVARYLNQCSGFGAVLDMVTDRSTTLCLMIYLSKIYTQYTPLLQFLAVLDLSSHYMHMNATLITGATSHKKLNQNAHPILRLYYHNRTVLFLVCAGNELMFVFMYLMYHMPSYHALYASVRFLCFIVFPVFVLKQMLNLVQFVSACKTLEHHDQMSIDQQPSKKT
ncbi:CDP-diacylglycerol-inositol 3-phosphatidyltransferase [Coelomomyces lativittatus]|nr:CDP-diacylglycerol-inositol 3-phosphatidyltransferase [Coelomomyces lativittatus]